jgi:hypothetical protein
MSAPNTPLSTDVYSVCALATRYIRRQGELGNQQQSTPDIPQAQIHAASIVRKHPISQQALQQTLGLRLIIPSLNPYQHQQSSACLSNYLPIDTNPAFRDPLQQTDHARSQVVLSTRRFCLA